MFSYTTLCFINNLNTFSDCRQFSDIHISQGSVATCSRRGGILNTICCKFTAESDSEKKNENRLTFGEVIGKSLVSCFFLTHSVVKLCSIRIRTYDTWLLLSMRVCHRQHLDRLSCFCRTHPCCVQHTDHGTSHTGNSRSRIHTMHATRPDNVKVRIVNNAQFNKTIRYDTIRDASLTCARKPT